MQIVSIGDNIHEMSTDFYGKTKRNTNLSFDELAQGVVKVKSQSANHNRSTWHFNFFIQENKA